MTSPGSTRELFDDATIRSLRRRLLAWYRTNARDLPWRRTRDPYRVWLSEMLLQQTRVETATAYYQRFITRWPTIEALASANLDDVLAMWAGLGYYRRARFLHQTARQIADRSPARFPRDPADLRRLPGIGRYTAGAIASIAFGKAAAAVDGNALRVLARLAAIETPIDNPATQRRIWTLAGHLLSPRHPGEFNQALMELGASHCRSGPPRCTACPLATFCEARRRGLTTRLPVRTPRAEPLPVEAAAVAVWRRGRLLLVQRPPDGLLARMWGLPAVELPPGADAETQLLAHLRERLGLSIRLHHTLGEVTHGFTHRRLRLRVYEGRARAGRLRTHGYLAAVWTAPERSAPAAVRSATPDPRPARSRPSGLALSTLDRKALALVWAESRQRSPGSTRG